MGRDLRRWSGPGLAVLVLVAGLVVAWLKLNHGLFGALVGFIAVVTLLVAATVNGFRQVSPASLQSRGIYLDDSRLPVYDQGLQRVDWRVLPFGLGRATFTSPTVGRSTGSRGTGSRKPGSRAAPSRSAAPAPARRRAVAKPAGGRPSGPARLPGPARRSRKAGDALHPDATVTLARESQEAGVDELLASLDQDLVGLLPVKHKVAEIGSLLLVDRARQRFGLEASRPNLHMCFTGSPGTGKTTVALMMADLVHRLGYLEKNQVLHAMRDDLVGEYIGQTAPRTRRILERAMGGVLFIDEAYALHRASDSRDYGQECIEILMQVMENRRQNLVVILAGYKDRMDVFFESNPGMRSRIAHHLDFAPYATDELLAIGQLMLDGSAYYLSDAGRAALRAYLAREQDAATFANARSVRNALENARLRHAYRLASEPERAWTKDDLMRLEPPDILPDLYSLQAPALLVISTVRRVTAATLRSAGEHRSRALPGLPAVR